MVDSNLLIKQTRQIDIYQEEIILRDDKTQEAISINRNDYSINKKPTNSSAYGNTLCSSSFNAIYGVIDLVKTRYLILITSANYVGEVLNRKVFQIEKVQYIPLTHKVEITSFKTIRYPHEDKAYLEMLDNFFAKKYLYFSFEYDLTNPLQKFCENDFDKTKWRNQYFFNESLMQEFVKAGLTQWISPVISGTVEVAHVQLGQHDVDLIIISRRDKTRSGMRFISRGCDMDGNCSNTAETEQIVVVSKKNAPELKVYSYLQLRGSMPFIWQQKPTLKWEPKGDIHMETHNVDAARKHFDRALKEYGSETLINLIDKKGTQKKLGDEFHRVVSQLGYPTNSLRLIWFDFHHECRKMKWENLSKLLNEVKQDINNFGFFEAVMKKGTNNVQIVQKQNGVFRTNCMDCLDRTNVVQSVITRRALWSILNRAEIVSKNPSELGAFEKFTDELEIIFRETWTRNADVLSVLYTGTNALKTDFTRTGKRTKKGALQDGQNSIMRYIKNNFYDGFNQNCIDLALAKLKPKEKEYKKKPFNSVFYLGFLIISVPLMMKYVLDTLDQELFAQHHEKPGGKMKSTIFYFTVFGLSVLMVFKAIASNSHKFIEKPLLHH